jgi:hypothetical protein
MSRKIWNCPNCEGMSSSRLWNVKRHLYIKHNGIGEPICNKTNSSSNNVNIKAYNSPRINYRYPNDLNPIPKSFHKHYDFAEETLNFLRKMVEYKNLLAQLRPTFSRPFDNPNVPYHGLLTSNFGDIHHTIKISNMFEKPFPPDHWIIIGFKGRVCDSCLDNIYVPVFFKFEGNHEIFEPQHDCYEIDLLYSAEETEEVLNTSIINLTKQMMKLIKIWLQGMDYLILARQIGEHYPIIGYINADQNDHWSARAIKDKVTTLKDDNELTDFLSKTNNSTFGVFKVYSSQQQSIARFYLFMIIKKEWL